MPTVCNIRELIENYTENNVYWLIIGEIPGLRMQTMNGTPVNCYPTPLSFMIRNMGKKDIYLVSFHFTSSDVWFWIEGDFLFRYSVSYTMPITLGSYCAYEYLGTVRGELFSHIQYCH